MISDVHKNGSNIVVSCTVKQEDQKLTRPKSAILNTHAPHLKDPN